MWRLVSALCSICAVSLLFFSCSDPEKISAKDGGSDTDTDADTDTDVDSDTDTDTDCECDAEDGPCCDGCSYYTASQEHVCETLIDYDCEGATCGADTTMRSGTRVCAGGTAECTGEETWGDWSSVDLCYEHEVCHTDEETYAECMPDLECLVTGDDTPNNWITIEGGSYEMGSPDAMGEDDEHPQHTVTVSTFQIAETEITKAQYEKCVNEGACEEPSTNSTCAADVYGNWETGKENHPINCISWTKADAFCLWIGGRLPSEAEWEFAARSRGLDTDYPWGPDTPSCDLAAIDEGGYGCGAWGSMEVCSIPAGNTNQGLCDMAGNVREWVQDWYHDSYVDAPTDGSAWEDPEGTERVERGGAFNDDTSASYLRTRGRCKRVPTHQVSTTGFRCARDVE